MTLNSENQQKLEALNNKYVLETVNKAIELCKPEKVTVITDLPEDINYVRDLALKTKEEEKLNMEGHTIHFDGYYDQARDKAHTKYLLAEYRDLGLDINWMYKDKGLEEVFSYLDGSMQGKEMLVRFFTLGPNNSIFSIPSLQITDSTYVAHSEDILYRSGYEDFKRLGNSSDFFYFLHSAGRLDESGSSADVDKRRIYIDLDGDRVFSVNNQYAGNSIGLKKLALRLAINKASREGWLTEHMFITNVHGPDNRSTYFTGAFPSACGKTSTAMIPGQTIVGDDIAYLKIVDGVMQAANVESGVFGIIRDVNPDDDPLIYKALTTPREMIFSNVLIKDGKPYWLGMGQDLPEEGVNYAGNWYKGKIGTDGQEVPPAHKNARYTIRISDLDNYDQRYDDPAGVPVKGIVYGGRDSDTSIPVAETLSWAHGVFVSACLESETTAATLGKEGERKHNPMANLDFLSIPIGKYIENHLKFVEKATDVPSVFIVNYFLRKGGTGKYLNDILDKKVWMLWMEGRVNGEYDALKTPVGYIPVYEDLKNLFKEYLNKEYTEEDYEEQFTVRIKKYLDKLARMEKIYLGIKDLPDEFLNQLNAQKKRLIEIENKYGIEEISPLCFT